MATVDVGYVPNVPGYYEVAVEPTKVVENADKVEYVFLAYDLLFSRGLDGHRFVKWNTMADGSGTDYYPNVVYELADGDYTLYAIWEVLVNKVIYGRDTLIDLTADTVTPEKMEAGTIAHAADGSQITGTAVRVNPVEVIRL